MGTEQGIEFLSKGVGLIPPNLALARDIGTDSQLSDVIVGHRRERVLGYKGNVVAIVIMSQHIIFLIIIFIAIEHSLIFVKLRRGKAVGDGPVEAIVDEASAQRQLCSQRMALASIGHYTTIVVDRTHLRKLLVAYLHVVKGNVEVGAAAEEIQVGAELEVPRLLGLVGDGFGNIIVVLCGVFYVVVSAHSILLVVVEFSLEHIAEHLDVVASSAITFRHKGVDIACLRTEIVSESDFRQELGVGLRARVGDVRGQMISGLTLGSAARHVHIG